MRRSQSRRVRSTSVLAAVAAALALVAAGCGSSGNSTSKTTTGGSATSAGGGGASTAATTAAAGPATTSAVQVTQAPADTKPKTGGKLVYGLEAENATGFSPQYSQTPIAGYTIMRTILDPLMILDKDANAHPFLAESMTHSDDYKSWTIKTRTGIKFHDGSDFDASVVKANLEGHRCSPLTGPAVGEFAGCPATFDPNKPEDAKTNRKPLSTLIKDITVDAADKNSVTVNLLLPFPTFDQTMATLIGWMDSPKNVADPTNGPKHPIGTGPFMFKEWNVGDHLTVVKNPNYWLKDKDGTQLPYLDEITFKPIPDVAAREEALRSGTIDMLQTSNGDTISKFRGEKKDWSIFETDQGGETAYLMLNHFAQIKGKDNPIADVRVRKALALAVNYDELNTLRNGGVTKVANGPFPPGSDGYLDDTGFPKYNVDEAIKSLNEYKTEKGITGPVEISLATTNDPFNQGTIEVVAGYWEKAGFKVTLEPGTEQGQFITRALTGDFQIFLWRNHGSLEADRGFIWWHSALATPPPGLALNFGRFKDEAVDKDLVAIRVTPDKAAREAAAKQLNKDLAAGVHNVWMWWTLWQFVADQKVQNIAGTVSGPDGTEAATTMGRAMHWLTTTWIKE